MKNALLLKLSFSLGNSFFHSDLRPIFGFCLFLAHAHLMPIYKTPFQSPTFFLLHMYSYERRRIIVRQGHPGYCFYFIVSGSVSVTITRKDYKTGVYVTNTVDVLEKNEAFGVKSSFIHYLKKLYKMVMQVTR